jgi:type IV pilus assembly protein PilQ
MKGVLNLSYLAIALLLAAITTTAAQETPPAPPPPAPQEQPKAQEPPKEDKKPQSPEEVAREQLERNLRATLQGVDVKVTMEFRNARVQEIIEEFRRQVRTINFVADLRNVPEEFRIDEFIVRNEPWRSAFSAFIAKAEMTVEEESATLIRLSRPPRVTFSFEKADIKTIISLIARMSGANIVMNTGDPGARFGGVAGIISMSVNNVPWFEVLRVVCKTCGYTTVRESYDIIRIVHQDELLKQLERRFFTLKYITGPPSYVAKMEAGKYVEGKPAETPKTLADIAKQFTLLSLLETLLTRGPDGKPVGSITFDPSSATIAVTDTRTGLDEIERAIKALDVQPSQVNIALKYISTVNEDLLTFGMNYSFQGEDGITFSTQAVPPVRIDGTTVAAGTATLSPFTTSGSGKLTRMPFGLGREALISSQFFLTRFDMLATFRAFKRDKYSKLIQEPQISVKDNWAATIFLGEEVPYAESQVTQTQTGGIAFTVAEGRRSPVKIGFQLLVSPKIIKDTNQVLLTVIPQNEFLSGTGTSPGLVAGFERFTLAGSGASGIDQSIDLPRIQNTTLVTTLLIENGRTAVLGGLKSERSSYEDKKIPFLGDLPLIDFLFKQRNDTIRKETLIIFVTPTIIQPSDVNQENLKNDLDAIRERERTELEELKRRAAAEELRRGDEQRMQGARKDLEKLKKGGE